MSPQEKALQLYNDAYRRWANELSHDKNKLIAKSIATYVCDEMLNNAGFIWGGRDTETGKSARDSYRTYLEKVKQEIKLL